MYPKAECADVRSKDTLERVSLVAQLESINLKLQDAVGEAGLIADTLAGGIPEESPKICEPPRYLGSVIERTGILVDKLCAQLGRSSRVLRD